MTSRERAAKLDDQMAEWSTKDIDNVTWHESVRGGIERAIDEAVAAERRRCAEVAHEYAEAIRASGEPPVRHPSLIADEVERLIMAEPPSPDPPP